MRQINPVLKLGCFIATAAIISTHALALDVKISKDIEYIDVNHNGETVRIERIQNQDNQLTGGFAKTSRKCPPFCIQPAQAAPGVATVGELEIIKFLKIHVAQNTGVLIDARTSEWHAKGTIPGSVNMPFTVFNLDRYDQQLIDAMEKLGVTVRIGGGSTGVMAIWAKLKDLTGIEKKPHPYWNYSNAKELLLWCNGMWCGQSPRAIKGLIKQGYPAAKLHYYRGGMTSWQILGLTVVIPADTGE